MDQSTQLIILTSVAGVLFVLGVPIVLCMATWTLLASFIIDFTIQNIGVTSYQGISSYALLAMPLFILVGELINASGGAARLSALPATVLRPIRGGMSLATIATCSIFSGISGSNSAIVATVGRTMIPEMKRQGYNPEFAAASTAAGGIVGILIPPSLLMVIYGYLTNLSIIDLFTAGWGPGIFVSLGLAGGAFYCSRKHRWGEPQPFGMKDSIRALWDAKLGITMMVLVLVLIYGGYSSPTEAASVVACFCILVGVFFTEQIKPRDLPGIFLASGRINGMLAPMIAISIMMQQILSIVGIPRLVYNFIYAFHEPWAMMLMMMFALFLFGSIMESISVCTILAPIMAPVAVAAGYNPYHFALVFIVGLSLGFITPPFAFDLFVASGITGIPYGKIIRWMSPFIVGVCIAWLLIAFYPPITLALFSIVGGGGF